MKAYKNIDQYLQNFPKDVRTTLGLIRETVKKAAPKAEEAISYGIPTFKLNGNLVHFAGYKKHIGLYPGSLAIATFRKELVKYKCSKGTIQFPLDEKIPRTLITKIVKFRVKNSK